MPSHCAEYSPRRFAPPPSRRGAEWRALCATHLGGGYADAICFRYGEFRSFRGFEVSGDFMSPKLPGAKAMAGKSAPTREGMGAAMYSRRAKGTQSQPDGLSAGIGLTRSSRGTRSWGACSAGFVFFGLDFRPARRSSPTGHGRFRRSSSVIRRSSLFSMRKIVPTMSIFPPLIKKALLSSMA